MTNIVVGSIIGADVYVATAIGARLVGPASILIWVLAGLMAMVIAISFAYCVMMTPRAGGPYAYVNEVSTPFVGFTVGWSLLLAEWFSLAVFPVAFAQYFVALIPGLDALAQLLLKAVFIIIILFTNLLGVKAAGKVNDGLTIAKLGPLLLIIIGGLILIVSQPSVVVGNFTPFATGGTAALGQALVLIFWAYAGFELSTLPADEIENPERTIPKSIVLGMLIVITFYLLTNFVVLGLVSQANIVLLPQPADRCHFRDIRGQRDAGRDSGGVRGDRGPHIYNRGGRVGNHRLLPAGLRHVLGRTAPQSVPPDPRPVEDALSWSDHTVHHSFRRLRFRRDRRPHKFLRLPARLHLSGHLHFGDSPAGQAQGHIPEADRRKVHSHGRAHCSRSSCCSWSTRSR